MHANSKKGRSKQMRKSIYSVVENVNEELRNENQMNTKDDPYMKLHNDFVEFLKKDLIESMENKNSE
jgi:hypothetical protein